MKLHYSPSSCGSLAILLLCVENQIPLELVVVDLKTGAQRSDAFLAMNPSGQIPVLEDDDFALAESSAILKYIADRFDLPSYPKDLRERARVNERMDWFNTSFGREWLYHLIYPQVLPSHARPTEASQSGTVAWGRAKAEHWLGVLDGGVLGQRPYLCGDSITIADYFGAEMIAVGDLIGASVEAFPNVRRWQTSMRALPSWKTVNEALVAFAVSLREKTFVTV